MSDSVPHGLQHARLPCLSLSPNSCPLSGWCYPTIPSFVVPFLSCPQSLPASGSSLVAQGICLQYRRPRLDPWVRKIPWRRQWLPTSVFLPVKFHAQRSLGATVHGFAKGQTWLKWLSIHTSCDLYFLLWDALPFKLSCRPSKNVLFKIKVYQRKVIC